ncbi:thioredoxin family protein [Cellulomonas sp. H30R-01]|uniref:TlpA family protein disulfide reductase n=1 Tax=Cellulomonas sp. H30R-01 TaxID=2704467 RepID=UPI00138BE90A|nr:thioredoxin family protein [Cellulomonas sp. H30R-01]QHT55457.1 thioredoxin family protein [Cellulomonas sp. H30R-01]
MTEAARTAHAAGAGPTAVAVPAVRGRRPGPVPDVALTSDDLGAPLGARATVVQFSSTFCVPCRRTRQVVEHALRTEDGVTHVDLDVADHLDLGERLAILSTPTVLVLDATGRVRRRATGVPSLAQLRAAIAEASAVASPEAARS